MQFTFTRLRLFILCIATAVYPALNVAAADSTFAQSKKQKNVVFIAGAPSHGKGEHEFKGGCTLLAKCLNENVKNIHAVVYDTDWPADTSVLENADVIVLYCDGGERHMIIPHLQEVDRLMKKGVGLVLLHYAVELPKGRQGDNFIQWAGGYFEPFWSVNPWWGPSFNTIPRHSITRGVKPFSIKDEWYFHMRFAGGMKNVTPLLATSVPKETLKLPDGSHDNNPFVRAELEKGLPQTMAWAFERPGGGRGFGFTGGHMHNNWMNDDFRKLVLNAIVWSAKEQVPKQGISSPTPTQGEMNSLLNKAKE